ncbi:MAG: transglutaminase-like cysteine peptidase [Marinobacterium sp.]|nr:transglutaminase-like cysteine peptidase [Marinobacterium sp.]
MPWLLLSALLLCALVFSPVWAQQGLDFGRIVEHVDNRWGERAAQRARDWQALINDYRDASPAAQMKAVNDFFNQLLFTDDTVIWRQEDYWATPVEFIGEGAGDCEDFTIAKYYTLVEMGFAAKKLRLMYVKSKTLNQHHMVLTYYKRRGAQPLVMDNIDPAIKPARKRRDLLPVYSFNADNLWLVKAGGSGQRVGGSERLSLWQDLRKRQASFQSVSQDARQ